MLMLATAIAVGMTAQTGAATQKPSDYKPYQEVITSDAKSQDGLFKVHKVGEKIYFEIPESELSKDMLWQAQETEIPHQLGSPGPQADRIVRWSRRGAKVYLNGVDCSFRSTESTGLDLAVRLTSPDAIIAAFKVEAEGPDRAAVIDVSDFLISDPKDLNIGPSWSGNLDRNRSYVDGVKSFPENIEMRSMLTFQINSVETFKASSSGYAAPMGPNASILMHYSFLRLPERPMMPRFRDPRVGYFGIQVAEIGGPENRMIKKEIIKRFRLEKKDPSQAISEPVKPIVFYVAQEVPPKWRPYIIKAIEAWRPAFEQAGFKNAIYGKVAPTHEEDPDWDAEDARYSVVRWIPSDIENSFGLSMADPRSGEIIAGHVIFYHSFLSWLQSTYFSQVAALDPAARHLPFGDKLMGKLLQYILTHEIGHAIGLEHNMKASAPYTIANLRDPAFVAKNDIAASIMDYARFDYVAQPGDNVPLDRNIGQYDKFAVEWGYKPIPNATSSQQEQPALNAIADRQLANPFLRFGNYVHPEDPTAIGEDLSNDPIQAAKLGILNLRKSAKYLVPATVRKGEDYSLLAKTYSFVVNQHEQFFDNAIRLVGGVYANDQLMFDRAGVYTPVPSAKQHESVLFMCGPEGVPPKELLSPEITSKLFASGDIKRVMNFQYIIVFSLFNETRIVRMFDQEAALGAKAYTVQQMLEDVQNAVFRELTTAHPKIDVSQRQYQLSYLRVLDAKLNGSSATRTELLGLGRASLKALAKRIDKAIPQAGNKATALHLAECRHQIEQIMNGSSPAAKIVPPAVPAQRFSGVPAFNCGYPERPTDGFGITLPPDADR